MNSSKITKNHLAGTVNYKTYYKFLRLRQTNSEREKRVAVVGIELARHARQSRSLAA